MTQINEACREKLKDTFPTHVLSMFENLAEMARQLGNPSQELSLWWEPEEPVEGDLLPSITFRLSPIEKGTDAQTDS